MPLGEGDVLHGPDALVQGTEVGRGNVGVVVRRPVTKSRLRADGLQPTGGWS